MMMLGDALLRQWQVLVREYLPRSIYCAYQVVQGERCEVLVVNIYAWMNFASILSKYRQYLLTDF